MAYRFVSGHWQSVYMLAFGAVLAKVFALKHPYSNFSVALIIQYLLSQEVLLTKEILFKFRSC